VIGGLSMLLLAVLICLGVIGAGVYGLVTHQFRARHVTVHGLGAAVMSSMGVFFGLAGLRGGWLFIRHGPERTKEDLLLRALLILTAVALGAGFVLLAASPL
jgi:hypothetical protein